MATKAEQAAAERAEINRRVNQAINGMSPTEKAARMRDPQAAHSHSVEAERSIAAENERSRKRAADPGSESGTSTDSKE